MTQTVSPTYPDGIEPATGPAGVKALLRQERAIHLQTEFPAYMEIVARETGLPLADLLSRHRHGRVADARRIAQVLAWHWYGPALFLSEAAALFGLYPSALTFAQVRHRGLMETDRKYAALSSRVLMAIHKAKRERGER